MNIRRITYLFCIVLFIGCTGVADQSEKATIPTETVFDIVILNGRVMDPETEFDAVRNVGQ